MLFVARTFKEPEMNMTLESLLEDLEKQAGLSGIDKQAADRSEDKDKDEKDKKEKEEKSSKEEKSKNPFAKAKEGLKDAEKEVDKEQTKEAQAAGADLANQIMQKVASLQISNKETEEMNKQASEAGKALADALLEKLANAGDQNTVNGIPEGVAPTKNQIDAAQQVAEQDSVIKPLPTKDAIGNGGGSINQIFDAIVADAMGQGAASYSQSPSNVVSSSVEGAVVAQGTPNQVATESVEKTAAVISLVNSGVDFDDAVDMVKAAAEEIAAEEAEQVKQAAFADLLGRGVDFDLAVALVKSAGRMDALKGAASAAKKALQTEGVRAAVGADNVAFGLKNKDMGIAGRGVKQLAQNRLVQGGAAAGAAGGAYALGREKQAAVSALCEAGVDFDQAIELVQAKSQEIYGA